MNESCYNGNWNDDDACIIMDALDDVNAHMAESVNESNFT